MFPTDDDTIDNLQKSLDDLNWFHDHTTLFQEKSETVEYLLMNLDQCKES